MSEEVISRQNRRPGSPVRSLFTRAFSVTRTDRRPGQGLTPVSSSTSISQREHSRDYRGTPRILTAHDNKHGRRGVIRVHSQLHGRGVPAVLRRPRSRRRRMAAVAGDRRIPFLQPVDILPARQHHGRPHGYLPPVAHPHPGRRGLENWRLVVSHCPIDT